VDDVLAVLAPGQGAQKPGMLTPWLELPGAEPFFRWAGAIADADLLTLGTTGDAEAITDTAVTQPLVVAMSLFVARELGGLPGPVAHTPQSGRDVVLTGHSVGELTAAAVDRGGHRADRRPRPGHGPGVRAHPDRHVRRAGR
jgi:[acyl-carrier-protein] S-malonyltransferase